MSEQRISQTMLWQARRDKAHGHNEAFSRPLKDWRGALSCTGNGMKELCSLAKGSLRRIDNLRVNGNNELQGI